MLRSARARGVTTFGVPLGPDSLSAERLLATAFPAFDAENVVLLGRSFSSLAEEAVAGNAAADRDDFEGRLRRSLEVSARRLAPLRVGILEWSPEPDSGIPVEEAVRVFGRLRSDGALAAWSLSLSDAGVLPGYSGKSTAAAPELFTGELSVLNSRWAGALAELSTAGPLGFFARNPLGGGHLDGSRFAATVAERRPDQRPVHVQELRREFGPVLGLGFLTEGHQRTLAQAALRFVYRWPWVCSALVPVPAPERLEELVAAETVPPLSEGEIDRVLGLSAGR